MNEVQVGQNTYRMPPHEGFSVAHFITVANVERSARFYERVFGGRIMTLGNNDGAPGFNQLGLAGIWLKSAGAHLPFDTAHTLA